MGSKCEHRTSPFRARRTRVCAALRDLGGSHMGMSAAVTELALGCLALKGEAAPPVTIAAVQALLQDATSAAIMQLPADLNPSITCLADAEDWEITPASLQAGVLCCATDFEGHHCTVIIIFFWKRGSGYAYTFGLKQQSVKLMNVPNFSSRFLEWCRIKGLEMISGASKCCVSRLLTCSEVCRTHQAPWKYRCAGVGTAQCGSGAAATGNGLH